MRYSYYVLKGLGVINWLIVPSFRSVVFILSFFVANSTF